MGSDKGVKTAVEEARKGNSRKKILAVIAIVFFASVTYAYFGIISPVVTKPVIEKSEFTGSITTENVNYLANELGAYKLHPSVSGEPAEMEIVSAGKTFFVTTENGRTVTKEGRAPNPDVRITVSPDAFARLFAASDMKEEILELYDEGALTIELVKDQATLAVKGYKGIYDELNG